VIIFYGLGQLQLIAVKVKFPKLFYINGFYGNVVKKVELRRHFIKAYQLINIVLAEGSACIFELALKNIFAFFGGFFFFLL